MKMIFQALILPMAGVIIALLMAASLGYDRGVAAALRQQRHINVIATPTLEDFAWAQSEPLLRCNLLGVAGAHACGADGELAEIMIRFMKKKMLDLTGGTGL